MDKSDQKAIIPADARCLGRSQEGFSIIHTKASVCVRRGRGLITLNRVFAGPLLEAELDFLKDRTVCVRVTDRRLEFYLALRDGVFAAAGRESMPELTVSGSLHAFLLLAARREDADTLFFRRRLMRRRTPNSDSRSRISSMAWMSIEIIGVRPRFRHRNVRSVIK